MMMLRRRGKWVWRTLVVEGFYFEGVAVVESILFLQYRRSIYLYNPMQYLNRTIVISKYSGVLLSVEWIIVLIPQPRISVQRILWLWHCLPFPSERFVPDSIDPW